MALADHFENLNPPEPPQVSIEETTLAETVSEVLEAAPVTEQSTVEIARLLYVIYTLYPRRHMIPQSHHRRHSSRPCHIRGPDCRGGRHRLMPQTRQRPRRFRLHSSFVADG